MAKQPKSDRDPGLVDLALQGGGSHGAFTWGVLDRLLEEPWLRIDGISGTSAGAMNAAALAYGHSVGGNDGARNALAGFWRRVSETGRLSPIQRGPLDIFLGRWTLDNSPAYIAMDMMSRLLSPYDLNLTGWNPLRNILTEGIDFERVAQSSIKLFITATNVATGRARVFRNRDLTPEVLIASACLPTMFQAIEIDGEAYWDGGYSGNPTITPLVRECTPQDTIIVPINPIERKGTPRAANDQRHILLVAMILVVGDVACVAILDLARRVRVRGPDRRTLPIFIPRALDLIRRSARAPIKSARKF